jgi:hypothetical protein
LKRLQEDETFVPKSFLVNAKTTKQKQRVRDRFIRPVNIASAEVLNNYRKALKAAAKTATELLDRIPGRTLVLLDVSS